MYGVWDEQYEIMGNIRGRGDFLSDPDCSELKTQSGALRGSLFLVDRS